MILKNESIRLFPSPDPSAPLSAERVSLVPCALLILASTLKIMIATNDNMQDEDNWEMFLLINPDNHLLFTYCRTLPTGKGEKPFISFPLEDCPCRPWILSLCTSIEKEMRNQQSFAISWSKMMLSFQSCVSISKSLCDIRRPLPKDYICQFSSVLFHLTKYFFGGWVGRYIRFN